MLTRTVEYAVRAIVVLARHYGSAPVSADTIASVVGGPRNYLSKTLNVLARHGILASVRGPGGGFSLAVSPHMLTVADIADVFADVRRSHVRCLLGDTLCDANTPCSAHHRWMAMTSSAREPLVRTTIGALGNIPPQGTSS